MSSALYSQLSEFAPPSSAKLQDQAAGESAKAAVFDVSQISDAQSADAQKLKPTNDNATDAPAAKTAQGSAFDFNNSAMKLDSVLSSGYMLPQLSFFDSQSEDSAPTISRNDGGVSQLTPRPQSVT